MRTVVKKQAVVGWMSLVLLAGFATGCCCKKQPAPIMDDTMAVRAETAAGKSEAAAQRADAAARRATEAAQRAEAAAQKVEAIFHKGLRK